MCFSIFSKRRHSGGSSSSKPSSSTFKTPLSNPPKLSNSAVSNPASNSSFSNNFHKFSQSTQSSHTSLQSLKSSLATNPQIYDLSQIRSATNNFLLKPSHASSSSTAWHTTLASKPVVITQRKLRKPTTTDTLRENLHRVCRSHHSSLVRLHGAAVSGANHIYLVYERVEGSASLLSECLRRNPRNPSFTVLSNWLSRAQIATDLADALDYLHNSSGGRFVHNHVKSCSVLVVEEPVLGAKLCHYGTAQLCGERVEEDEEGKEVVSSSGGGGGSSSTSSSSNRAVKVEGTRGYMSPEFVVTGVATRKSDVYAFGVVLLELLSGEEPLKFVGGGGGSGDEVFKRVSLVESGREMVAAGSGGLRKWVDWRLKDSYPVEVVERMVKLAVECCEDDPDKRPDMGRVAGFVSKQYLDSKLWAERFGVANDFTTTSFAPR